MEAVRQKAPEPTFENLAYNDIFPLFVLDDFTNSLSLR